MIEKGDTLYSLGKRYHVSVSDLMRANPYVNVYNLRIGEELCIPVRPQPRMEDMNGDNWNTYPSESQTNAGMPNSRNMQTNMAMPDSGNMQNNTAMPEMRNSQDTGEEFVEEEELKTEDGSSPDNQFSENDSLKDVLGRMGLSMSDFMECLSKKMD